MVSFANLRRRELSLCRVIAGRRVGCKVHLLAKKKRKKEREKEVQTLRGVGEDLGVSGK